MPPSTTALWTARTHLREFDFADGEQLLDLFREPEVRGFLLDDVLVSPQWMLHEIAASQQRFARGSAGMWAVRLGQEPEIVGFAGFREFFDPPELQLLYGFLPAHWGKGLATEVTARLCDFAFRDLGFDRITAATDLPNRASARVLRRLGMQLVRTTDDGRNGTALFELDREAWAGKARSAAD